MTRVILASASPRRRDLLATLIPAFDVLPAEIEEPLGGDPAENARQLAAAKAAALSRLHPRAIVIAADTIVHDGLVSYGKPKDAADAAAMLRALSGRSHNVVTGVAVMTGVSCHIEHCQTTVRMAALSDTEIEAYVASGRPLDKAGAYAIQDDDAALAASWDGCYCNVVGLPLWTVNRLLTPLGLAPSEPAATPHCAACPGRPARERPQP